MASAVYPKSLITGQAAGLNLSSLAIKVVLLDTATYTYNAAHQFYSDLVIVGTKSGAVGSKTFGTVGTGVVDGADVTISAYAGTHAEAIAVFVERGGATTADDLLSYNELSAPVTGNGGDVTVQFNAGGIFNW